MAVITSTATGGNASAGGSWLGGVAPVGGDTIVVAVGATINIDVGFVAIPGSNASGVGPGITVNGTLTHSPGVTLTLRGFDAPATYPAAGNNTCANPAMLIAAGGTWTPGASTVAVDCTSDYQTIILNKGTLTASGTTFTAPSANYSWATQVTGEVAATIASAWWYNMAANLGVAALANPWIANNAGTGIGSFGDTSLVINSSGTAMALSTEVALGPADNPAVNVTSSGKYAVDYDMGILWFWVITPLVGTIALNTSYKRLVMGKGYGIDTTQSATSAATFIGCTFRYGGATTATPNKFFLNVANRTQPAGTRPFSFTGNDVRFCGRVLNIMSSSGLSTDYIPITGNTFYTCGVNADAYGCVLATYSSSVNYLNISSNILHTRNLFYNAINPFGTAATYQSIKINDNTGVCPQIIFSNPLGALFADADVHGNTLEGVGLAQDTRQFQGFGGAVGHPVVISGNQFTHPKRTIHLTPNLTFSGNLILDSYHHAIAGSASDNLLVNNVTITDNVVIVQGGGLASNGPSVQIGYNHKFWVDNILIANNTLYGNLNGAIDFGDVADTGYYLGTNVNVLNNLMEANGYGYVRPLDAATQRSRLHLVSCDYNLSHGNTTAATLNYNGGGTFTQSGVAYNTSGTRAITGVALFDPNYVPASVSLVYTMTATDSNVTLAWGGGTALQLVFGVQIGAVTAGNFTQGASGIKTGGTLTDAGASFSTVANNAACPRCLWLKITGSSTNAGEVGQVYAITDNTATVLTCAPYWRSGSPPSGTITYAIYQSEVKLFDAGGTNYVRAGVLAASLPAASQTDAGISFVVHDVTGAPGLVSGGSATAADYKLSSVSSAAYHAGTATNAPATDYFGVAFAVPPSIGFAELVAAGRAPRSYPRGTLRGVARGVA